MTTVKRHACVRLLASRLMTVTALAVALLPAATAARSVAVTSVTPPA